MKKIQILLVDAALYAAFWLQDRAIELVEKIEDYAKELNQRSQQKSHE
jgi:uncharacterized protein with PhoU and TrkA domain